MSDDKRYEPAEKIFIGDEPGADDYVTKYDRKNTEAARKKRLKKRKQKRMQEVMEKRAASKRDS